ncbi:amino acid ABC transporter permease [Kineococcus sp. SYSU DK006]|uniref:amino acid ABC transporter permease n=1 Tax=Kineococcus sp. SYSU DK006 TaxID=3383127 RepID=UPI003D7D0801
MSNPAVHAGATGPVGVERGAPPAALRVRRRPRPWNWLAGALTLVFAALLVAALVVNPNFEWGVVAENLFSTQILAGLGRTLQLTVLSMLVGVVLGTLLAVMRGADNLAVSGAASLYVWFFRGTPLLVQLIFWYNLSSLYPTLSFGIPGTSWQVGALATNSVISPYTAALLGLGLNQAAYTAEIVRAGILSVPHGQLDAAASFGMSRAMTMRRVVLPQAMRVIIPPVGNETIGMLKTTSVVSVLAMPELLYSAQIIYARTYQIVPLLIVASLWYLAVTSLLTLVQVRIERVYAVRGPSSDAGPWSAFAQRVFRVHAAPVPAVADTTAPSPTGGAR